MLTRACWAAPPAAGESPGCVPAGRFALLIDALILFESASRCYGVRFSIRKNIKGSSDYSQITMRDYNHKRVNRRDVWQEGLLRGADNALRGRSATVPVLDPAKLVSDDLNVDISNQGIFMQIETALCLL